MFCIPFIAKPRSPAGDHRSPLRFDMGMTIDMILAVAVEAIAAGAVPKFQIGVGNISPAADGAFVGVGRFDGGGSGFVRAGSGEGDDFRATLFASLAAEQPPGICLPGNGNDIKNILAEE